MTANPCEGNLDTTVVSPTGTTTVDKFTAQAHPKIDCFYVYPTVSKATTANAPLTSAPEIIAAARAQASLFAKDCRLFVPIYRQTTLAGLSNGQISNAAASDLAYNDVLSAWHDYLLHDNDGRGVVLIGHSQGAIVLRRLIQSEIDSNPSQRRLLVSALLMGANVSVADGSDRGGDFTNIGICRTSSEVGCVVAYSTFASTPGPTALFGRTGTPGRHVVCVDPAQLVGGAAALKLQPILPSSNLGSAYQTFFVAYPDRVNARCSAAAGANVLLVSGTVSGRPITSLEVPNWGLHTADISIALGDLVQLVGDEAAAYH